MSVPRRTQLASPLLLAALVPSLGFVADDAGGDEFAAASDNVRHVKQLEYDDAYGDGANQGSDLEFATITLPKEARKTGGFKPKDDADGQMKNGIQRTYAFAGAYDNGLQVVDVTDPEAAEIVAVYDCGISQGDVQVFQRDGGTYVTFTLDSGYTGYAESACYQEATALGFDVGAGQGTFIADVSNPYAPATVSWIGIPKGSHNQTVHPSGDYLYNSNSDLITSAPTAGIEVHDIRDLANPELVTVLPLPIRPGLGTESHDLTFSADGARAYSAALSQTVIIDTTDPAAPSIVSSFVDPAINVEHQASPITIEDPLLGERDFLIVEDEFAGAAGAEQTCPSGGVHVYDITGDLERTPVKVGYWNTDATTTEGLGLGRCTAHVFELHEDEQLMTIAYYNIGVRVVDLSGLVGVALGQTGPGMQEVASAWFDDSDTWAVKAPFVDRDGVFHIYGNDQDRGLDVYEVDLTPAAAEAAAVAAGDQWLTPAEADRLLTGRVLPADYSPYCLLGDRGSA